MLKKIIISRGRVESMVTHKLLSDFTLLVCESEKDLYAAAYPDITDIKTIPDSIVGLGRIRNYCIDLFPDNDIVILDDDIKSFVFLGNLVPLKIHSVDDVDTILQNTYEMALDSGAYLWGFNQLCDVRKFTANNPIRYSGVYVGCVVGIIRNPLRFDENNKFKVDVDYTLQQYMENRIIFNNTLYGTSQIRDTNKGGNSMFRKAEDVYKEMQYLKDKWGKYIHINKTRSKESLSIRVVRKQNLTL